MSNQSNPPVPVPPGPQGPPPETVWAQALPVDYEKEEQRLALGDYIDVLLRRKKWIIGTFLVLVLGVAALCWLITPIYRVSSILQITEDNPASNVSVDDKISSAFSGSSSQEKFQQTQYKILESRSLARQVLRSLNMAEHPEFIEISKKYADKSPAEIEEVMIDQFQKKLEIKPVANTYLVEVAFKSTDKELAQKVVEAVANQYIFLSIDRRNDSFKLVRDWLNNQLQQMALKVQEAQKKLYKFGQKANIYSLEDKDNVIIQKFVDLNALLTKAQAERLAKEALYKQIQAKGPNAPVVVTNPLIVTLREDLVRQQAKVSSLRRIFRPNHPELMAEVANLRELQSRLDGEIKRLMDSVRADYEAASRTEKLLTDTMNEQKGEVANLQDNLAEFQILKRDAQTNEQLYQALLARVKEANIASTMIPSNVAIIDPGGLPLEPHIPRPLLYLAVAGFLGLLVGVVLAFVVEHLDDSIKSTEDLERFCGLPAVGVVPLLSTNGADHSSAVLQKVKDWPLKLLSWKKNGQRVPAADAAESPNPDLMVYQAPSNPLAEALRHAQASIMLSVSGGPPRVLVVTSPNPSEGKTMISSNLAIAFALNGKNTVIIDCDLRKPRDHKVFNLPASPGITTYLSGNATLDDILQPTQIPGLTLIAAGPRAPSPANLLHSDVFKALLQELRQRFQQVIIDTPPIVGFVDARLVAALADGVVLVTRQGATHRKAGRLAQQLLSQIHVPIVGAILNGVSFGGSRYSGYYNYYYKYYSNYYSSKDS